MYRLLFSFDSNRSLASGGPDEVTKVIVLSPRWVNSALEVYMTLWTLDRNLSFMLLFVVFWSKANDRSQALD